MDLFLGPGLSRGEGGTILLLDGEENSRVGWREVVVVETKMDGVAIGPCGYRY